MKDIAPELLEEIKEEFQKRFDKNEEIKRLYEKVRKKNASYKDAHKFAEETGEILAEAFGTAIFPERLPDGRMYYNIANRIIPEMLKKNYDLTTDISMDIQKIINENAGIGIKAIRPKFNEDKVQGIVNIVSGKEEYEKIAYMLVEPIVNFTQSIVDDAVRENADFQSKAGLSPKIRRTSTGKCCEWCDKLTGVYEYDKVSNTGNNVFRRHKYCRCTVEFEPGDGRRQNVHSKKWSKGANGATMIKEAPREKEKRVKEEKGLDFASRIAEHPKMLRAFTPNGLYHSLKNSGYEIKPLKGKNYKDIPFEEGGGFRVHFGGDGILMYHPGERSHHGGEYYKISSGKGGTKRYDREGNEIEKDR